MLHTVVQSKLLILLIDFNWKLIHFDLLLQLELSDLSLKFLDASKFVVLCLEQLPVKICELLLRKHINVIVVFDVLLHLLNVLFDSLTVRFMPKPILEVPLVEVTYHVLGLVLAVVYLLDSVEDHHQNDFVRHDACLLIEVLVAFLNSFYRRFQHVFRLAVHADTDCQPDLTLVRFFEEAQ